MEYQLDINKISAKAPKDIMDGFDQCAAFTKDLLEAYQIMQGMLMFPDPYQKIYIVRMQAFLQKYSIEQPKEIA